mmetsp:Transcript_38509/g.61768  ORF Transcript_38509/g.61768 Transcript_38509/m.61768 type:complete len:116 (-) Transcript_38509:50-397(-)
MDSWRRSDSYANWRDLPSDSLETTSLDEPLVNVFKRIGDELRTQYCGVELPDSVALPDFGALCDLHARRLVEQHWLVTVRDLRELDAETWVDLGLPIKLERSLKACIGLTSNSRR